MEQHERPAARARFARSQRLRRAVDFQRVRRGGRQTSGPLLALSYKRQARAPESGAASAPSPTRVGFSVSRRVGGAVARNRVRRRLREIIRHQLSELAPEWDIIVVARGAAATAAYPALESEVQSLLARAHLLRADRGIA